MLPDLDPHRRKGVLFALGLDHYIRIPAFEGAQKGSPVAVVHGVCVRTGLLDGVLTRRPSTNPWRRIRSYGILPSPRRGRRKP